MTAIRRLTWLVRSSALALALLCAACAAPKKIDQTNVDSLVDQFVTGKSQLTCLIECIGTWAQNEPKMQQMYQAGQWAQLSRLVVSVGFNKDVAWFYLGRAAEEMRLGDAALAYYDKSLESTVLQCNGEVENPLYPLMGGPTLDDCNGIVFPDDVIARESAILGVPL
jgi:hypothetical protein